MTPPVPAARAPLGGDNERLLIEPRVGGPASRSTEAPALQSYGERRAAVREPFDNQWYLAAPGT